VAVGPSGAWQRELDNLFEAGTSTGLTDRDTIERFAGSRDQAAEAAFEAIVMRHGPMVRRVCRTVLPNPDDVDDAFQATFLVLARQIGAIRKLDSVASWLYGVASRVAARTRVDAARRRKTEERGIRLAPDSVSTTGAGDGLEDPVDVAAIQEEVGRLPEKYRSVVLLCFWEGLTQEQAAHRLGCPIGTVRSRVARARDLLRHRLLRRGLAPASGAVAFLLDPAASSAAIAPAALPPGLVVPCAQAAARVAAGRATAEVVSARIAFLVQKVIWSLTMTKFRNMAVPLALAGVLFGGASLLAQQARRERLENPPRGRPVPVRQDPGPTPVSDRTALAHVIEPPDLLLVEVLQALPGRPISGERLVRPDGTISLGFYGDVEVAGLTIPKAKEKIVQHLRKFLADETLGLVMFDPEGEPIAERPRSPFAAPPSDAPETYKPRKDTESKPKLIDPKDTDRVFVEVTAYNSRNSYVEGEVGNPGRFPFTGSDRVLDMIHYAGGLLPWADRDKIRLIRSFPKGSPVEVLPVDYEEITMGTDQSTNYEIRPGDRLVVPRDPKISRPLPSQPYTPQQGAGPQASPDRPGQYFDRRSDETAGRTAESQRKLERRLDDMERKLDAILSRLGNRPAR
jgi:polysaccharide export outer membrane protein